MRPERSFWADFFHSLLNLLVMAAIIVGIIGSLITAWARTVNFGNIF